MVVCWFYVCVFGLCSYETVCCLGLNCFVSLAYGGFLCGWLVVVAVFAVCNGVADCEHGLVCFWLGVGVWILRLLVLCACFWRCLVVVVRWWGILLFVLVWIDGGVVR